HLHRELLRGAVTVVAGVAATVRAPGAPAAPATPVVPAHPHVAAIAGGGRPRPVDARAVHPAFDTGLPRRSGRRDLVGRGGGRPGVGRSVDGGDGAQLDPVCAVVVDAAGDRPAIPVAAPVAVVHLELVGDLVGTRTIERRGRVRVDAY